MAQSDMVQSLLKAIDILRLIAGSENGMRLNEIAEAFDMKKTTVHNLIRTLRARGFLEKDSSNRFIPGPAVQELASMRNRSRMLSSAGKELRKMSRRFPEAVLTFSEITPSAVVCRLRMSPDRPGELQHPSSLLFTPYLSATAICLQANGLNGADLELNFPFEEYGAKYWESESRYSAVKEAAYQDGCYMDYVPGTRLAAAFFIPENFALGVRLNQPDDGFRASVGKAAKEFREHLRAASENPAGEGGE